MPLTAEYQQCDTRSNKNITNTAELTIYAFIVCALTEHDKSKRKSKEEHAKPLNRASIELDMVVIKVWPCLSSVWYELVNDQAIRRIKRSRKTCCVDDSMEYTMVDASEIPL